MNCSSNRWQMWVHLIRQQLPVAASSICCQLCETLSVPCKVGEHRETVRRVWKWSITLALLLLHHPLLPKSRALSRVCTHGCCWGERGDAGTWTLWGLFYAEILGWTSGCLCVWFVLLSSTTCRSWDTARLWPTKSSSSETTVRELLASSRPSSHLSWRAGWAETPYGWHHSVS